MTGIVKLKDCYEVGYWCHKSYCRQGYISEALQAVMDFAVSTLETKKFSLLTKADNVASVGIAKKFQFRFVGEVEIYNELRPE